MPPPMPRLPRRPARLLRALATSASPKPKSSARLRPLAALAALSAAALVASGANARDARLLRTSALLAASSLRFGAAGGTGFSPVDVLDALKGGGVGELRLRVVDRLVDAVVAAEDAGDAELLRVLAANGALEELLAAVADDKPADRRRLIRLVRAVETLLDAVNGDGGEAAGALRLSLLNVGVALGHLVEQDALLFTDLLRLGDALLACRDKAIEHRGMANARAFSLRGVRRSTSDGQLRGACEGFAQLCSPEMPRVMKLVSMWGITSILQAIERNGVDMTKLRQIEDMLSAHFAAYLLTLPRGDAILQVQAAQLLDVMLRVVQQNPALVPRDTYESWMKLIRRWAGQDDSTKPSPSDPISTIRSWTTKRLKKRGKANVQEKSTAEVEPLLPLQLLASSCLRTLSSHPLTCRYLRESPPIRVALFELTRSIHERITVRDTGADQLNLNSKTIALINAPLFVHDQIEGVEADEIYARIQANTSRAFRNICRSFNSGHTALDSLFASTWTASLLQSRRDLPMSHFFRDVSDLTELPVIGAEDYDATTEFGWIDILTAWISSPRHEIRENAIDTLTFLAEQRDGFSSVYKDGENETANKQNHILQAWLTSMLQHVRLVSGGEILAVRQMEQIAKVSDELTPGNENVLFNPAVVDAGTSAIAVLAEHHHDELVRQGVVPLMALLGASPVATDAQKTECARVLANLVATCCIDLDSNRPNVMDSSSFSMGSGWKSIWRHCVAEHFDVEQLLRQTYSGRHVLRDLAQWSEQLDPLQRSQYYRVVHNLRAYNDLVVAGKLTRSIYCEGVHPIVAVGAEESEDGIEDESDVDIVFVHGLRGHPFGTWRTDMGSDLEGSNDVWPDVLLRPDLDHNGVRARIITLGYEAGVVSWSSPWPSLTLQERAGVMLDALNVANVGRRVHFKDGQAVDASKPVVFIAHSMGGLLVKKMLLLASEREPESNLAGSTEGVVFLAVPHFGSALANGVRSEAVRSLIKTHPALQDLAADGAHGGRLTSMNESFTRLGIDCLSLGEEKPAPLGLGISAVVVSPESSNPGIGRFHVLRGADHMTICKAKSTDEEMYREVLSYVLERQHLTEGEEDDTSESSSENLESA